MMKEIIKSKKFAIILSHKGPDGDSIGSSVALSIYLKKIGLENKIIVPDHFPDFLGWMDEDNSILCAKDNNDKLHSYFKSADIIFCLDFNQRSRVGEIILPFLNKSIEKTVVVIDHHTFPENFGDHEIIDTSASSTSELIYNFINDNGDCEIIDKKIAQAIYLGLVTDTGSFKYSSTTSYTHKVASHLIEIGVDHSKIQNKVYDQKDINKVNLLGYALQKIKIDNVSSLAYLSLSEKELNTFKFKKGDTEGFVNHCLSLKGVEVGVFLRQDGKMVKISFRSKGLYKVNEFAKKYYNGGGHQNAAGGSVINEDIRDVERDLIKNFRLFCLKD